MDIHMVGGIFKKARENAIGIALYGPRSTAASMPPDIQT
jgi:hypothetical protein